MRRPQGYGVIFDPLPRAGSPTVQEFDTVSCGHCNRVIHVKAGTGSTVYLLPRWVRDAEGKKQPGWKEEAGAFCRCCMKAVCLACHAQGACTPLLKRLDAMEARGKFLQAVAEG